MGSSSIENNDQHIMKGRSKSSIAKAFITGILMVWLAVLVSKRLLSWKRHENTSQVTQQPGQIEITSHLPPASILNAEWPAESWELPAEPLNIFLFWTTSRKSFRNRNYQVIDAYFYHHPDAKLHIIASNLTQTDFLQYIQLGYHIQVHSLNDQYLFQLSEGCPMAKPWLDRVHEWRRGQYFYSHITDFMRFCLLYQYGGMYSDFDAIALQPMDKQLRSFIGKDKSNSGGMCEWCLVGGENYLAPGVMAVETKHHPLLEAVLSRGFNPDSYDSKIFGAVGPQAITKAYNSLQNPLIEVLENHILYPYTFVDSAELMRNRNDSWGLVERMKRTSLSLHFFGHTTRGLAVEPMSILAAAFNHTSLIVRNSTTPSDSADCGLLLKVPAYIPAGKGYGRVNDVRILVRSDFPAKCDASELRFWVNLRSRNGELKMPLVSRDKSAKLFAVGADQQHTIAELNYQLSRIFYQMPFQAERDEITVELVVQQNQAAHSSRSVVSSHVISVYNPSKLVTIMIKTFGRMEKVFSLVHSIKKRYPYISIIASDDSERAYRVKSGKLRFFDYLALPYDTGLSGGRNQMLQLIKTEYFLTLDDDFQFDENSVIEGLLHGLEHGGFDIVAGKNPRDEHRFKLDFCGLFRIDTDTLYLEPGEYGVHAGCNHVDFVPNLFVARTSLRDRIKWDDQLKLGEHEDFFLRAKSLGLRVGTCAAVAFHHDQVEHWLKKTNYDKMRSRVYDFWRISLRKHKLKKIRSFGTLMMDLTPPKPLKCLRATDILPYSLTLNYDECTEGRRFIVAQSLNGSFFETVNGGEGNEYKKKRMTVMGLTPKTKYWFLVYSGNGFEFENTGRSITASTNTLADVEMPLKNWGFEAGHFQWVTAIGSNFHIIEAENHTSSFVGRLTITKRGYLSKQPTVSMFYQDVHFSPADGTNISSIFISGQSKVERLYGTYVDWRVGAWVYFHDGSYVEAHEKFEKANGNWQIRSFNLCINPAARISMVRVYGMLGAFRGAVMFDDIFMVPRRGEVPKQAPVY